MCHLSYAGRAECCRLCIFASVEYVSVFWYNVWDVHVGTQQKVMKAHTDRSRDPDIQLRPSVMDRLSYHNLRHLWGVVLLLCCITTAEFHLQGKGVFLHVDNQDSWCGRHQWQDEFQCYGQGL